MERDAGVRETLHRVAPGARLPADLPGRYYNPDIAADLDNHRDRAGMTLRIAGPLRQPPDRGISNRSRATSSGSSRR